MPLPLQQTTPRRSLVVRSLLLVVGCSLILVVLIVVGLSLHPHRPFVTASSIWSKQFAYNGSDSDPNRHYGISYEVATTRASFLFYNATVVSGRASSVHGLQPDWNTTSIAGLIDIVVEPSFSAALRAGRLPVRLQLTMDISFGSYAVLTSGRFCIPNLIFRTMHLDEVERHFPLFTGLEVTIEKRSTVTFREDGSVSESDVDKLRMIQSKSKIWELLNDSVLKSVH